MGGGGGARVSLDGLGEGIDTSDGGDGAVFSADVLVDATGARCDLFTTLGFEQVTALKSARALGVVCHFVNGKTPTENALTEANWAQQYHKERFADLKDRGVNLQVRACFPSPLLPPPDFTPCRMATLARPTLKSLALNPLPSHTSPFPLPFPPPQNIVYYRSTGAFSSTASHYFVMTADADSLCAMGALRSTDVPESQLCASRNVDRDSLVAYVRIAVAEFVPELGNAELINEPGVPGVQIFDFSERKVSNRASVLVDAQMLGGSEGQQVLVTRVGDALQEPFWPEGLGINRGFLHCFDCADLVQGYCSLLQKHGRQFQPKGASAGDAQTRERADAAAAVLQRREELFGLVKRVSGTNRLTELKPTRDAKAKAASYSVDPASRYVHLPRTLPPASY